MSRPDPAAPAVPNWTAADANQMVADPNRAAAVDQAVADPDRTAADANRTAAVPARPTEAGGHAWLDAVRWDDRGLVAAIAQDAASGRVLMVAWMNREALAETTATGRATYWSRSRGRLWRKGEQSGHVQTVRELRLDCDGDAILLQVEQAGGAACHTGRQSCFFSRFESGRWVATDPVLIDPERLYR